MNHLWFMSIYVKDQVAKKTHNDSDLHIPSMQGPISALSGWCMTSPLEMLYLGEDSTKQRLCMAASPEQSTWKDGESAENVDVLHLVS